MVVKMILPKGGTIPIKARGSIYINALLAAGGTIVDEEAPAVADEPTKVEPRKKRRRTHGR
jgi:hypothetical protein